MAHGVERGCAEKRALRRPENLLHHFVHGLSPDCLHSLLRGTIRQHDTHRDKIVERDATLPTDRRCDAAPCARPGRQQV